MKYELALQWVTASLFIIWSPKESNKSPSFTSPWQDETRWWLFGCNSKSRLLCPFDISHLSWFSHSTSDLWDGVDLGPIVFVSCGGQSYKHSLGFCYVRFPWFMGIDHKRFWLIMFLGFFFAALACQLVSTGKVWWSIKLFSTVHSHYKQCRAINQLGNLFTDRLYWDNDCWR